MSIYLRISTIHLLLLLDPDDAGNLEIKESRQVSPEAEFIFFRAVVSPLERKQYAQGLGDLAFYRMEGDNFRYGGVRLQGSSPTFWK